jgi:hypothetical protein
MARHSPPAAGGTLKHHSRRKHAEHLLRCAPPEFGAFTSGGLATVAAG